VRLRGKFESYSQVRRKIWIVISLVRAFVEFDERRVISFISSIPMLNSSSCCPQSFSWSSLLRRAVRAAQDKSSEIIWPFCAALVPCCRSERYSTAVTNKQSVRDGCNLVARKKRYLTVRAKNASEVLLHLTKVGQTDRLKGK